MNNIARPSWATIADLAADVRANGNVLTCQMAAVRDAYGAGRLGKHVANSIQQELASLGMGTQPAQLPQDQWSEVRLFALGSQVAEIIAAAHTPGADQDQRLREVAGSQHAEIVARIRDLVCD